MKKRYHLSVTDFAYPSPRTGSIDTYSGYGDGQMLGSQIHLEIQQQRLRTISSYRAEVNCQHSFTCQRYQFDIRGKIDGVYGDSDMTIEEIKTAFDIHKLHAYLLQRQNEHPYILQLKTYGYLHWLKYQKIPQLNLHLVSARNRKSIDLPLTLHIDNYEQWLARRLQELINDVLAAQKRSQRRKKIAKTFQFPFANPRAGQIDLIATVKKEFQKNRPLLIQAPTGLGKTMGILYPTLLDALARGQKAVYVTPKNSQHTVVQDAVNKLQVNGEKIKSITITAKSKLCFKAQTLCNSDFCEYAKDYYSKKTTHNLSAKLNKIKNLTADTFKKFGQKYEVCPFELQMDNTHLVDTIICDYNYAFAPHALTNNRISKLTLGESEKPNLIIDEIHNLPSRGMDYYSPKLSCQYLTNIIISIETVSPQFKNKFLTLLTESSQLIASCGKPGVGTPHQIIPPVTVFKNQEMKIREFLGEYVESDAVITSSDLILAFSQYWLEFTTTLEMMSEDREEFFTSFFPHEIAIKITCCDASNMLSFAYDKFKQTVGFSATTKPFQFYSQLTGLPAKKLQVAEFSSPFAKQRRKIIIIPQISSTFSQRTRNYPRIAEVIAKISRIKKGNYFIFFPSFDFMNQVLKVYQLSADFTLVCQTSNMQQREVMNVLLALRDKTKNHLIFAVQGGIFAEGVDYPGEMVIGAFIVGTPLPIFNWEREQMKVYYEKKYAAGFDYAYVYPAMAKSIQAAGRVIRSETDAGIIIFMDNRFLADNYAKCMPDDWHHSSPKENVSQQILTDVKRFWQSLSVTPTEAEL